MYNSGNFLDHVKYNHSKIGIFTLNGNNEDEVLDQRLAYTHTVPLGNVLSVSLMDAHSTVPRVTLNRPQVTAFFDFLGDANSFGYKYRNVIGHNLWRAVYGVTDNFPLQAYNSRTQALGHRNETAVACRKCWIILPTRIITIDHQRPQTGGEILAILRVFRGLGLTQGGPRLYGKNHDSVARMAANVGGNPNIQPAAPKSDPLKALSSTGDLYYSVIKSLGWLNWLKERCMHHYLNLRPLCGPCNSSLSNKNIW